MHTVLFFIALACSGPDKGAESANPDSGDSSDSADSADTSDSADSADTVDTAACNGENEDCAISTCDGEGPNMLPGSNCLACHTEGGDSRAPPWSVGGTLFTNLLGHEPAANATVHIEDAEGTTVDLLTSLAGNFYTPKALVPPLRASVVTADGTLEMVDPVETGACNSCHRCEGEAGGKLFAP